MRHLNLALAFSACIVWAFTQSMVQASDSADAAITPKALIPEPEGTCKESSNKFDGCIRKAKASLKSHPSVFGTKENGVPLSIETANTISPPQEACNAEPIGPKALLTSAHCLNSTVFGGWREQIDTTQTVQSINASGTLTVQRAKPSMLCVLREWKGSTAKNDIGIIHLAEPLQVTPRNLAPLPPKDTEISETHMFGFVDKNKIAKSAFAEKVEKTDVASVQSKVLFRNKNNVGCHKPGSVHGMSGMALLTKDHSAIMCVNSRGSNSSCRHSDRNLARCAPLTDPLITAIKAQVQNPGSDTAFFCKDLD
jgi:hypothetical protein